MRLRSSFEVIVPKCSKVIRSVRHRGYGREELAGDMAQRCLRAGVLTDTLEVRSSSVQPPPSVHIAIALSSSRRCMHRAPLRTCCKANFGPTCEYVGSLLVPEEHVRPADPVPSEEPSLPLLRPRQAPHLQHNAGRKYRADAQRGFVRPWSLRANRPRCHPPPSCLLQVSGVCVCADVRFVRRHTWGPTWRAWSGARKSMRKCLKCRHGGERACPPEAREKGPPSSMASVTIVASGGKGNRGSGSARQSSLRKRSVMQRGREVFQLHQTCGRGEVPLGPTLGSLAPKHTLTKTRPTRRTAPGPCSLNHRQRFAH